MPEGFHPPVEEYLSAMYELEEEGVPVIRARLAERLGHTAPTVTEGVRRLVDEGYVFVEGRSLRMTTEGRRRAESVVRKHRLAERLLVDIIGLDWHKIHMEAGRWEHVISDEVEERLIAVLDNPTTCPHGNPIPGAAPSRPTHLRALSEAVAGERVVLERVVERVELDFATLAYLDKHGLRPGAAAVVRDKAPDGSLTLDVNGGSVAVGPGLAGQLYVAESGPEEGPRGKRPTTRR